MTPRGCAEDRNGDTDEDGRTKSLKEWLTLHVWLLRCVDARRAYRTAPVVRCLFLRTTTRKITLGLGGLGKTASAGVVRSGP